MSRMVAPGAVGTAVSAASSDKELSRSMMRLRVRAQMA
jgi:hypothetical protein